MPESMVMSRSHARVSFCLRAAIMLALMVLTVLLGVRPAQASTTCGAYATIPTGKYWIYNNLWGQNTGSGWQCIWDSYRKNTTIGWGTSWSWTGPEYRVKSYTSAVLGWHWGTQGTNTGLPIQVSSGKNINTRWTFNLTQHKTGTMNIAYDLWLHTTSHPGTNDAPSDEVMVWLSTSGGPHPVGNKQATLKIGGTTWDLYEGTNGWKVHTFMRTTNTTSQTLNLKDFLSVLVARNTLSNAKYLNGIEAGAEIFTGNGQLDSTIYETNVW